MYGSGTNLDVSELCTGKDGRLYFKKDTKNYFFAEVNEFKITQTHNSTTYQGAGSNIEGTVPTGVKYALTFTEALIRDDLAMEPLQEAISRGETPIFAFSGMIKKPTGDSYTSWSFPNAVPNGDIDIMNVTPGDVVKRAWSFALNSHPDLIHKMVASHSYGYTNKLD